MTNSIQVISINHSTHGATKRLQYDLAADKWESLFTFMTYDLDISGYVHISTCNRIEIYYESSIDHRHSIVQKWLSLIDHKNARTESPEIFKTLIGIAEPITYLLEVSMGLHSAIPGDDQILSQLKKQFLYASNSGHLSTLLERAFQSMMRLHKQICRETEFKNQTVSLAYHTLKSIGGFIPLDIQKTKHILIIGAGEMAAQLIKHLGKFTFATTSISNRTSSKAELLAQNKDIVVVDYNKLNVNNFNIVISCTEVGCKKLGSTQGLDLFIDLSVSSGLHGGSTPHLDLEAIQNHIRLQNEKRFSYLPKVKTILAQHAQSFVQWEQNWSRRAELQGYHQV